MKIVVLALSVAALYLASRIPAGTFFQTAVTRAKSMPEQVIALPESYRPPLYQWRYLLALTFVIWRG